MIYLEELFKMKYFELHKFSSFHFTEKVRQVHCFISKQICLILRKRAVVIGCFAGMSDV